MGRLVDDFTLKFAEERKVTAFDSQITVNYYLRTPEDKFYGAAFMIKKYQD